MKILIIASTQLEIESIQNNKLQFSIENMEIDYLITGVGILHTTIAVFKKIQENKYVFIIQIGLAGSFNQTISLGQVCLIQSDFVGDSGVFENNQWHSLFDLHLIPNNPNYLNQQLENKYISYFADLEIPIVRGVTVNQITTDKKFAAIMVNKYQVSLESLEGAALHYIAIENNIPFLQIRSVSNYVGERNKSLWDFKTALFNLGRSFNKVINSENIKKVFSF